MYFAATIAIHHSAARGVALSMGGGGAFHGGVALYVGGGLTLVLPWLMAGGGGGVASMGGSGKA